MGEIADAIRRARVEGGRQPAEGSALSGLEAPIPEPTRAPLHESAGEPRTEVAPSARRWIETIDPNNPAVLPEDGPHAEVCRHIALRLRDELDSRGARSVVVVSAERGDGKTTVACNLAVSMASLSRGRSVALVDLDLRKPSIASYLTLNPELGIEQVLLGKAQMEDVQISVRHPAIDVYPAVTPQRAAHELMVLPKLAELVARLERHYGTVIIDTPPAPLVPDANLILRHVSCAVPVVRKGKTRARSFRRLVNCLPAKQVLGWVMNCDRSADFRDHDYYYYGARSEQEEAPAGRLAALGLGRFGRKSS